MAVQLAREQHKQSEPCIKAQIEETARQFPSVKKVKVFIGTRTLEEAIR